MTRPTRRTGDEPPIGRRVAELRVSRGMSQQVFADRIGRSKSWVDKVERGVRTLDRFSVIETVA
ncbi:helix-turn-helix domain-containing protein, partial [Micromonospora sp. DH15]|nr:helix-turn-helix domain-containing protein [Micromonospora sp. DH15]